MSSGLKVVRNFSASSGDPSRSANWKKAFTCTSISAWLRAVVASVLVTSTSTPWTAKMLVSIGPPAEAGLAAMTHAARPSIANRQVRPHFRVCSINLPASVSTCFIWR